MTDTVPAQYKESLFELLGETFEQVQGRYLDRGTSLFETLATVTAAEASRSVSATCATLAAQVAHTRFYIDLTARALRGEEIDRVDWGEIWRTVTTVTEDEWAASVAALRDSYQTFRSLFRDDAIWAREDTIGESLNVLIHTAYHLGEIRQALCTLKQRY